MTETNLKKQTVGLKEHDEQVKIFDWAKQAQIKWPCLEFMYSTLNGVKLTYKTAKKAKRAGNKRGVLDIHLPFRNKTHTSLYIELKVGYNKTTKEQDKYIKFLTENGARAEVCYGSTHAINTIIDYLSS